MLLCLFANKIKKERNRLYSTFVLCVFLNISGMYNEGVCPGSSLYSEQAGHNSWSMYRLLSIFMRELDKECAHSTIQVKVWILLNDFWWNTGYHERGMLEHVFSFCICLMVVDCAW